MLLKGTQGGIHVGRKGGNYLSPLAFEVGKGGLAGWLEARA